MITAKFENKELKVFYNGKQIIDQPFRPTPYGDRPEWQNEKEAMDWLVSNISMITAEQEEKDAFVASLNSTDAGLE